MKDIGILVGVVFGLVVLLALISSKPPGRDLTETEVRIENSGSGPITNNTGQTVVYVEAGKTNAWLSKHRNVRVVCMAGYVRAQNTTGYYIIYDVPAAEARWRARTP